MYRGTWRIVRERNRVVREMDRGPLTLSQSDIFR
jgi:hypothetical protein